MENKSMEQEYWKDIKGFEGYYQISSHGRVKSLEREIAPQNNKPYIKPEKILKGILRGGSKHISYCLKTDLVEKYPSIKQLILENFIFSKPSHLESYNDSFFDLFHINGEFTDYVIENLYINLKNNAIRVFDYEGNWLGDYCDAVEFGKHRKIKDKDNDIYTIAKGILLSSTEGFQFRYLKATNSQLLSIKKLPSLVNKDLRDNTPVAKYFNGRIICVYNNITDAAEANLLTYIAVLENIKYGYYANSFTFKRIE